MYTIDVDIGSTCTDGFFTDGRRFQLAKVITTPHDLSECTVNCIKAGASLFGLELKQFLKRAVVARLSSTIGTNLVVQRTGARVGLLVTRGNEAALYGERAEASLRGLFVSPETVLGVDEEVDREGVIRREPDREDVLAQVRKLVERGVTIIVVSLRNAWRNSHNERLIRDCIRTRYPVQYLRSVPLQLGTEVVHTSDDHGRTNSAVLNAYIHSAMAWSLYRIEDRLRDNGYARPLLVVHAQGGSGRIAKTVALHTLSSGPAVGVRGAAELCRLLGIRRALTMDMGGTSLDAALIIDYRYPLDQAPIFEGVRLATPMVAVESIAAGGSTIARLSEGELVVGPQSVGTAPGPACYGRGGRKATVTDVNLVLGYMNPDYFLGGTLRLDPVPAERAIEREMAKPGKNDVHAAALAVREQVANIAADKLRAMIAAAGVSADAYTMLILGGCGALHACSIAERIGIGSMVAFPYSSVFSAFGASTTDVQHVYRRMIVATAADQLRPGVEKAVDDLLGQARRDMSGEGFGETEVRVSFEATVGGRGGARAACGESRLEGVAPSSLADALLAALLQADGFSREGTEISLVATAPTFHWRPESAPPVITNGSCELERKGERPVYWNSTRPEVTPIYAAEKLVPGCVVCGPAIVESPITNYVVAPNWTLDVDPFGNFRISNG